MEEGCPRVRWSFSRRTKIGHRPGIVGVTETPTSIAIAYANAQESKPKVQVIFQAADTLADKQAILKKFVAENQLQGVLCSYVLSSGDYSLNLVDAPLVAKEEIPRAMRWVVRDLINFPVEEAVIDIFEVPFPRVRDNVRMIYAAVMRKPVVDKIEALINPSGLSVAFIDIPELVLRNILVRNPQKLKGCVFVYLGDKGGKLILCRDEQICIARSFELKLEALGQDPVQNNKILESLALEIQRSFDYMNSVFRQNIPNVIVMAPTVLDKNSLEVSLKSNLGAEVYSLKLSEQLTLSNPMTESDEVNSLLAIGATLRTEEKPE